MPLRIEHFGLSNVGLVRQNNEDAWEALPQHNLYALADGLGGKNSGEIAARAAIEEISSCIQKNPLFNDTAKDDQEIIKALHAAIVATNLKIWEMAKSAPHLNGMGTTLTLALFWDNKIILGNVGDSRIYRVRSGKLEQLTHDDSLVFELLQFGLIDEEEAKVFPLKHVITKSIGGIATLDPSVSSLPIENNDIYLLCSDGLHGLVENLEILSILQKNDSLENISHNLIKAALSKGGHDNVTVIIIKTLL
ncbi:MAG: Stp1/IreP family PP2C-type Ser/Thr phosphatase [Chlamydiales bacterium]|nr:Stp1/IreP family PP2C-type Ser/Thr phosphatase [Chlamydiales bacterium]